LELRPYTMPIIRGRRRLATAIPPSPPFIPGREPSGVGSDAEVLSEKRAAAAGAAQRVGALLYDAILLHNDPALVCRRAEDIEQGSQV